jgi:hypothetical protein
MKTPPAPEDTDGVFHAFTSGKVAALERKIQRLTVRSRRREFFSLFHRTRIAAFAFAAYWR